MKTIFTITAILLISNICLSQKNIIKKSNSEQLSFDDYIENYGLNDTSIAIIEIYFDHQNRLGAGLISFLPLTATITIVSPPIGLALMAITSPMVVKGVVSYGKFRNKNLVNALQDYQYNDYIANNLKNKLKNYFDKKELEDQQISDREELLSLRTVYNTNE